MWQVLGQWWPAARKCRRCLGGSTAAPRGRDVAPARPSPHRAVSAAPPHRRDADSELGCRLVQTDERSRAQGARHDGGPQVARDLVGQLCPAQGSWLRGFADRGAFTWLARTFRVGPGLPGTCRGLGGGLLLGRSGHSVTQTTSCFIKYQPGARDAQVKGREGRDS